jgi:hypothetical protein
MKQDNLLGNEINKFKGQDSVETLKLIMWCLESLHKLQKSLDETVDAVSKAKSEILAQIYDKVRCPHVSFGDEQMVDLLHRRESTNEVKHWKGSAKVPSKRSRAGYSSWRAPNCGSTTPSI